MEDFPHIGALCKKIRESHKVRGTQDKLTQEQIGKACGVRGAAISAYENNGAGMDEDVFDSYVQTLVEKLDLPAKVKPVLISLRETCHRKRAREAYQEILQNFSFRRITREKQMVRELREERYPSYIMDQLWFVHAFNAPILRLFDIDMKAESLHNWESWHVISTKYHPDSSVRKAHPEKYRHGYFPPACQRFFEEARYPFLFTPQMRELLYRLQRLSGEFEKQWRTIVDFSANYPSEYSRTIVYRGSDGKNYDIQTQIYQRSLGEIEILKGQPMEYKQVTWQPKDDAAKHAFEQIANSFAAGNVAFACEYIQDYSDWGVPKLQI